MSNQVELIGLQISNLRGFSSTALSLEGDLTLLVGPNNSGKTSVLRLLDWVLNHATEETLLGDAALTADELNLLVPARETRNAARRLILRIRVSDGRRHTRFQCDGDIASLRIGLRMPGVLRLNLGRPRRNETSDHGVALDLLREIREGTAFSLVPAARDAQSESFRAALRDAVMAKLEGRATHRGGGGAPAEYREIKKSLKSIRSIADDLVLPLWEEVKSAMPPGLANDATVTADLDPASLVSWIADRIELRITTGAHDQGTVPPAEVGSGLQSLLELALQQTRFDLEDIDRVIAVEEPEAFLHPSAQRTLARIIAGNRGGKRIVSTHSPVLVDEAKYGEIVLVRDHRFYAPAPVSDAVRNSINTALLNGYGAEMAFAASVLLVEGDGDRAYYEVLRRRLASASGDGRLDNLAIVPVGSKTAFAPWLRMLKGYGEEGDRPIGWLVVADGDAAKEVLDGHRKAGLQMPSLVKSALADVSEARNASDQTRFIDTTTHANAIALEQSVALHLSPIDLEYAVLMGCSDDRAADLASEIGLVASDRETLTCTLRNNKQAFRRADLAMRLGWHEVSEDTRDVLRKWFSTIISNDEATQIVEVGD